MAPKFDLTSVWRNVKELDLQRIRQAAEEEVRIAVAGGNPADRQLLAQQLRSDPRRPESATTTLIPLLDGPQAAQAAPDLILYLAMPAAPNQADLLAGWGQAGLRTLVLIDPSAAPEAPGALIETGGHAAIPVSLDDWAELQRVLAPKIIDALPNSPLALGRRYPLLRETIARRLIQETANANAAYSFSTGLAEIIPILGVPLNVADMIVLTKAQALLVYKLGLALGMSPDWQYYLTEFSGVIGSGFLWRQVARSLVGLIPAWGIIPKVAVAYSGTYAVGQAVLHWYLTGRHVSRKMLGGFMREALGRGRTLGRNLRQRLPGSRRKAAPALPAGIETGVIASSENNQICVHCSTINDADARFCKNCGKEL